MGGFLDNYLDEWANQTPDATAFRFAGAGLSYAELSEWSARLGAWLNAQHIGPGDRVGILMAKSLDMPVAVYGTLKSGAAYVPLDPSAPPDRTAAVIEDCGISVIISQAAQSALLGKIATNAPSLTKVVGADVEGVSCHALDNLSPGKTDAPRRSEDDPAYIIFTSGSTGAPKGMVHTHRSARAYADMAADLYNLDKGDRMGNHSALHFDMSKLEFFAGISRGATVVLVPEMVAKLPASMSKLIEDEALTVWYSVPFALIQLEEAGALEARNLESLRWVIFAGEPMSSTHLNALQKRLPYARFSNAYGPAEVNVVTYHHLPTEPHDPDTPVPIGTACPHSRLRIEDGTLLVATPAMMQGYWQRPDLNEKAILRDNNGTRFYRTGDLVSEDSDGNLVYLGRADRQVKIRGFRIELEEVEHVLGRHPDVSEAAALPSADGMSLEAFVTLAPGSKDCADEIASHVHECLPAYAVPARITIMPRFERTSTGKIDRKALRSEVDA